MSSSELATYPIHPRAVFARLNAHNLSTIEVMLGTSVLSIIAILEDYTRHCNDLS